MQTRFRVVALGALLVLLAGCPAPQTGGSSNDGGNPAGGGGASGDVSNEALGFGGRLAGEALTASTTDAAQQAASGRKITGRTLASGAVGWLSDLEGHPLRKPDGQEYGSFPIGTDGAFGPLANLPVGVDLLLMIDENGDGKPELVTIFNIPAGSDPQSGALETLRCDPLSTMVYYKLRALLAELGVSAREGGFSAAGLVGTIRDAFEHLFEEAGIEQRITIDDLANLTSEQIAALFDALIPEIARRGMHMARGRLALENADTVEEVAQAAAALLIQGGFVIADHPGGVDLSFLAAMPNVRAFTFREFQERQRAAGGQPEGEEDPQQGAFGFAGPTVYVSALGGRDRNFDDAGQERDLHAPLFSDHVLARMAALYLDGRTVSLGELYRIVVDIRTGLGVRVNYHQWGGPDQPPLNVFFGPGGVGVPVNLHALFRELQQLGLGSPDPSTFEQRKAQIRNLLIGYLGGTAEPPLAFLFDGILMNRVPDPATFAAYVRDARAHLPFSRSGPARLYVLATADRFQDSSAQPVTVDVQTNDAGKVIGATFRPDGGGKFYLQFAGPSDNGQPVMFVHRELGRPLHSRDGQPQQHNIADASVFAPVGGLSFFARFSRTHTGYPGAPVLRIPNPGYDPTRPAHPETNPPDFRPLVLVDRPGPAGEPIRVDYMGGQAVYSPTGQYYLIFGPRTPAEGLFELIKETGELLELQPGDPQSRVYLSPAQIQGITIRPETFTHVYGLDVPNPSYDASGAPYYDDVNGNSVHDAGEPTFDHRPFLHNPQDWRSTWIEAYYRRAGGGFVQPGEVEWGSDTPRATDGTPLVPRVMRPRLNAFRFGNPSVAVELLTAFGGADFFDGTHALNEATRLNPFAALAILNLVFGSVHNVDAVVDIDGPGPAPTRMERIHADLFILPIGDPVQLIMDGFELLAAR